MQKVAQVHQIRQAALAVMVLRVALIEQSRWDGLVMEQGTSSCGAPYAVRPWRSARSRSFTVLLRRLGALVGLEQPRVDRARLATPAPGYGWGQAKIRSIHAAAASGI